ncbi:hypothetical protein [Maritalea porphyrae]|uniref:GIY-YIG domain-containing protein n=1 Tax=Maritalea porphyrae TaxID=880732 RepID=A0ABQ5UTH6_9HYPH|nr:hypothetical protein [Maritalea porphyrae]GLQ17669.1 hypothetical protein GCM10007879_19180 [Maritalea porphyrae]
MGYIDELISDCNRAAAAEPKDQMDFEWQVGDEVKTALEDIQIFKQRTKPTNDSTGGYVYVIRELGGNPITTFEAAKEYKSERLRNCPRMNSPSPVMYVGSSATDIRKRAREHLGYGSISTYSLHLAHWFRGTICVEIKYYDVKSRVLQIIEDEQAHDLKPAFGKMGGK